MPTRTQNLYNNIQKNKRGQNTMQFPNDLETSGHGNVIRFNINVPEGSKYVGGGIDGPTGAINKDTGEKATYRRKESNSTARRFSGNSVRIDTVIDLYMPPEVQTSYQTSWNNKEIGTLGSLGDTIMNAENMDKKDWMNVFGEAALNALTRAGNRITPFDFESGSQMKRSTISNPYMEVLFEGVDNRTFSFTFKMIPRNVSEQETIKNIVKTFKFHQAPEVKYAESNQFWKFPSEFDIKFLHRGVENDWLFRISTCALTNFSVDYSPEGQYSSHADGAPFATSMTLQFTEMEVHTKENIMDGF